MIELSNVERSLANLTSKIDEIQRQDSYRRFARTVMSFTLMATIVWFPGESALTSEQLLIMFFFTFLIRDLL